LDHQYLKKKELRKKYENLLGQRFIEGLKKEPMVSLSELVDRNR